MNDYLKLQIKNPNTDKSLWFDYPFKHDTCRYTSIRCFKYYIV